MEFCRNGLRELIGVVGRDRALGIGRRAARLTGLQNFKDMADVVGSVDGDALDASRFLAAVFEGMGDDIELEASLDRRSATLRQRGLRFVRGIKGNDRDDLLSCWIEIWRGAVASHREFIDVSVDDTGDTLVWILSANRSID